MQAEGAHKGKQRDPPTEALLPASFVVCTALHMACGLSKRQLNGIQMPVSMQDLNSSRCRVPCRWEVDEAKHAQADVVLYTPLFDPTQAPLLKKRANQLVALANVEAIFV